MFSKRFIPWLLAVFHLLLAGWLYHEGMRLNLDAKRYGWNWMWQVIPVEDLLLRPWSSFWHLHAQPPGFSLWGLFWLRMFGEDNFPASMEAGYVLIGGLVVVMTWHLALALSKSARIAGLAALGMAANPAMLLFESYSLYEMLMIGLIVGTAAMLWRCLRKAQTGEAGLVASLAIFAGLLNLLTLTRSLYHWFFLWTALAFAWPALKKLATARRIAFLLIAIAPTGLWYGKNYAQYGFFGGSSWFGLGLYKCVSKGFTYWELEDLRKQGILPEYVAERSAYQHPPSDYVKYGFDKTSPIPLLNRNDFHNINIVDISKGYEAASKKLIFLKPSRYIKAFYDAYRAFCIPPSYFVHIIGKEEVYLKPWDGVVSGILYGTSIRSSVNAFTGWDMGSMFFFYFPVLMAWAAFWTRSRWRAGAGAQPADPLDGARALLMGYMIFVCMWILVVGCLFESGENMRFRFASEPFTLIMVLMFVPAAWRRTPQPIRDKFKPDADFLPSALKRSGAASPPPGPASSRKSPGR